MKFSKKIKTLAAVSVLAIGIPAAGIAYASPGQYLNMSNPSTTQQMNQNAGPMAGTTQQLKMTPGSQGPMTQTTTPAPADNSKATTTMPMVNTSMPAAHNQGQMPQMDPKQMNIDQMNSNHQAMTATHQAADMSPGANGSGHSNMNSTMNQGNHDLGSGSGGMGGHN